MAASNTPTSEPPEADKLPGSRRLTAGSLAAGSLAAGSLSVELANRQSLVALPEDRLRHAVVGVLAEAGIRQGEISLAVVDDAEIRQLNVRWLDHDYATDCLSFVLDSGSGWLAGQIVVSAETALRTAPDYGWSPEHELLLYVVHGALHLSGYDDREPAAASQMRAREAEHLRRLGVL